MVNFPSVKLLSQDFELLTEIDTYTSLRFKRSWQSYGEFELHLSCYNEHIAKNKFIMLDNNVDKVGIIKSVSHTSSYKGVETIVKGYHLNGIMTQRIILPYTDTANHGYFCVPKNVDGIKIEPVASETILKTFVRTCFPSLSTDPRSIGLKIPDDRQRGMKTVWMSRYEQLDEVLQSICEYTDIGYRVYIDFDNKCLVFDTLMGVDRSSSQSENSRVIMSQDFESINNIICDNDTTKMKNVAYAGGVGEDENRLVFTVTNNDTMPIGLERNEVFIYCGTLEAAETDETLSLSDEGKHKLLDYKTNESMTADYNLSGSFIYGKHFDLGDLVTVADKKINKMEDKRITEVEECYEAKSISIKLTFGTAQEHLNRVIKSFLPTVK